MLTNFKYLFAVVILYSCSGAEKEVQQTDEKNPIEGTWQLLTGTTIENGDTTITDHTQGQYAIKMLNGDHFAFFNHDLTKGTDSVQIFVSGGGRYSLDSDAYTEHLEFCNYREWEDQTFDFKVNTQNDTLVQTGHEKNEALGVDRIIIEKYVKIKD